MVEQQVRMYFLSAALEYIHVQVETTVNPGFGGRRGAREICVEWGGGGGVRGSIPDTAKKRVESIIDGF